MVGPGGAGVLFPIKGSPGPGWGNNANPPPGSLLNMTSGQMTVVSNGAAGGAVYQLWYKGNQYINNIDFGRYLQSALFFYTALDGGKLKNPTEVRSARVGLRSGRDWLFWRGVCKRDVESRARGQSGKVGLCSVLCRVNRSLLLTKKLFHPSSFSFC